MELDSERLAHECAACLDPRPGLRVRPGQLLAEARVGEGDPVLDVRREIVGVPVAGMMSTWNAMPDASGIVDPAEIGEFTHSSRWI